MRKILAVIFLFAAVILYFFLFLKSAAAPSKHTQSNKNAFVTPSPTRAVSQAVLFVPYWSTGNIPPGYREYAYFAVVPTESGIDTTDPGYSGISTFATAMQNEKTLLTVSMQNADITEKILQDSSLQEKIIQDTIHIVRSNGFDGVVLDLEYKGLAFENVTQSVTAFSTRFAQEVEKQNLFYYQTLYGDTFYLGRPYDVGKISSASDGIFVLAYDFHKANGTPGPNFPLVTGEDTDYNFSDMITDFTKKVAREKMTVIFGMFGYDWTIDDKQRPEKTADSMTDKDIQHTFLAKCGFKNCLLHHNSQTKESSVSYTDTNGEKHIVWFEDAASIIPKEKILQQNGVSQIGFWANGYF